MMADAQRRKTTREMVQITAGHAAPRLRPRPHPRQPMCYNAACPSRPRDSAYAERRLVAMRYSAGEPGDAAPVPSAPHAPAPPADITPDDEEALGPTIELELTDLAYG